MTHDNLCGLCGICANPLLFSPQTHCTIPNPASQAADFFQWTIVFAKGFRTMAVFYVLPSRQLLGQRFGEILSAFFPGASFVHGDSSELAATLAELVSKRCQDPFIKKGPDTFLIVYREDLDESVSVKDGLIRDFGAELHDEIIEIHFGAGLTQFLHQHWAAERLPLAA